MSIRTIRFNKTEEQQLKLILTHYGKDFSNCVKDMLNEKIEDLSDIGFIKGIKEGSDKNYLDSTDIDKLF